MWNSAGMLHHETRPQNSRPDIVVIIIVCFLFMLRLRGACTHRFFVYLVTAKRELWLRLCMASILCYIYMVCVDDLLKSQSQLDRQILYVWGASDWQVDSCWLDTNCRFDCGMWIRLSPVDGCVHVCTVRAHTMKPLHAGNVLQTCHRHSDSHFIVYFALERCSPCTQFSSSNSFRTHYSDEVNFVHCYCHCSLCILLQCDTGDERVGWMSVERRTENFGNILWLRHSP